MHFLFCYTKLNSITLKKILLKSQFSYTIFNSVSQKSILLHTSRFCLTKFETELNVFQTSIDHLQTGSAEFCISHVTCRQKWIFVKTKITFVNRNYFCWQKWICKTELNSVPTKSLRDKIEFCVEKKPLCWQKRLLSIEMKSGRQDWILC